MQIKLGAPIMIKVPRKVEKPLDIAKLELEKNVLPMTVKKKGGRVRKKDKVKIIPKISLEEKDEGIVEESEGT